MSDHSAQRDKIASQVKALLAMTTSSGCTEFEAASAAAKASELMAKYDLTYADLDGRGLEDAVRGESYGARRREYFFSPEGTQRHPVRSILANVALFWDCVYLIESDGTVIMFGERNDSEHALAMLTMLQDAIDHEWATYYADPLRDKKTHGRAQRTSFMAGITHRLGERLDALKAQRSRASSTGTSLVVLKTEVVRDRCDQYLTENNYNVTFWKPAKSKISSVSAYTAGLMSGNKVNLSGERLD